MPKDRVFLLVIGAVALAGLVCLLSAAVYLGLPSAWASAPPVPATPTQALNLAALPTSVASPTSLIPALPPEWTAAPFPTRAAPTASQPALAPLNASVPASPIPSATLPAVDAGPPTSAPTASPIGPSASPVSGASPAATAGPPGAPSPTAPPPTTPQASATNVPGAGGIGQRIEAGGLALTVMGVSKQEDSSSVYLVVDVVLENVSREQAAYEYIYFSVVDSEGLLYYAADAPEPSLQEGDLARGSQVRGNVAFYIGPETHGLIFIFTPLLLSDDSESIQVSLGQ